MKATIKCMGELHTVELRGKKLVLHNHNIRDERALIALGGEECECMKILRLWKSGDGYLLPKELSRLFNSVRAKGWERFEKRVNQKTDPLVYPMSRRAEARVVDLVIQALGRCRYQCGPDWVDPYGHKLEIDCFRSYEPEVNGRLEKTDITISVIKILVKPSWYTKVYKQNLAVVDGCLVVDVLEHLPGGEVVVLAGKPVAYCQIRACEAVVRNGQLRWLE